MHTGENFINTLFELKKEGREKIVTLDLSYNENLDFDTIKKILSYLPNLKNLQLRGFGWQHVHPSLLQKNKATGSTIIQFF